MKIFTITLLCLLCVPSFGHMCNIDSTLIYVSIDDENNIFLYEKHDLTSYSHQFIDYLKSLENNGNAESEEYSMSKAVVYLDSLSQNAVIKHAENSNLIDFSNNNSTSNISLLLHLDMIISNVQLQMFNDRKVLVYSKEAGAFVDYKLRPYSFSLAGEGYNGYEVVTKQGEIILVISATTFSNWHIHRNGVMKRFSFTE